MIEGHAFPSDRVKTSCTKGFRRNLVYIYFSQYAVVSQLKLHGYTEEDGLIILQNRPGEHTLRTEDILATIQEHGDSVAVVFLSGVHYYTGKNR